MEQKRVSLITLLGYYLVSTPTKKNEKKRVLPRETRDIKAHIPEWVISDLEDTSQLLVYTEVNTVDSNPNAPTDPNKL